MNHKGNFEKKNKTDKNQKIASPMTIPIYSQVMSGINQYIFLLLFLCVGFWLFPIFTFFPRSGLDPSWVIGLNLAYLNNLQYGPDLVFSYGILGFLEQSLILDYTLWRVSIFFAIFTHFLFIISLYLLLKNFSARWYHYVLFIPILLLFLPSMSRIWALLIAVSIFLYLVILQKSQSKIIFFYLLVCGFLLAVDSLIKFDMMWNSLYLILGFCVITFVIRRDLHQGLVLVGSYIISFFALWLMSAQHFSNVIPYMIGGLEVTKGYSEAMAISGPAWQVCVGFISITLLLIIGLLFFIRKNKEGEILFVLNLLILFSAFKSGFVRNDNHVLTFFCIFILYSGVFIVLMYGVSKKLDKDKIVSPVIVLLITAMIICSISVYLLSPSVLENNVITKKSSHEMTLQLLNNQTDFNILVDQQKTKIKSKYPLDIHVQKSVDGSSVDIIPWDIALCWAYDFNWTPRPVFQSYSAYTPYLDTLNSQHFSDPTTSPDKILYAYGSIDGRYPLFDEPKTFRTIINNYIYADESGGFILLNRASEHTGNKDVDLGSTTVNMGSPVKIPIHDGEIFGHVTIKYSLLGNLLKIIYKPAPVYVSFQLKNGFVSPRYRLIPETAQDGLYLSQYVSDTDSLAWLFQGHLINNIDSIIIETDQPGEYSKNVEITFTGNPYITTNLDNSLMTWEIVPMRTLPEQQSVTYNFKSINGQIEPALFEHSMTGGSEMIINNLSVPEKAHLNFEISLDSQVWSPDKGDGVGYQIYVNSVVPENLIFSQYIDPKHNATEQRWNPYQVDLSPYAGDNVTLIFSTNPGPVNNGIYDWAWWGNPRITNIEK